MPRNMDDGSVNGKQHHQARSRIPGPKIGRYQVKGVENGFEKGDTGKDLAGNVTTTKVEHKRFESFVMTGEKIIQKSSPQHAKDAITPSPTEKRKKEVKHSPVPLKKDGRSKIARPSDSPKSSPKRKAPQRAVIESPKATRQVAESPKTLPKRVVHSPPSQRRELVSPKSISPKSSPKKDTEKSPAKQSRLPRFTPKNSPKLTQKEISVAADSPSRSDAHSSMDQDEMLITVDTMSNVTMETVTGVTMDVAKDTNGAPPPRHSHMDARPYELELLGYPRFPDMPVELDIPPDDISSEDERFKHEDMLDIDELPPPPDEFFNPGTPVIPDSPILEIRPLVTRTPEPYLRPEPFFSSEPYPENFEKVSEPELSPVEGGTEPILTPVGGDFEPLQTPVVGCSELSLTPPCLTDTPEPWNMSTSVEKCDEDPDVDSPVTAESHNLITLADVQTVPTDTTTPEYVMMMNSVLDPEPIQRLQDLPQEAHSARDIEPELEVGDQYPSLPDPMPLLDTLSEYNEESRDVVTNGDYKDTCRTYVSPDGQVQITSFGESSPRDSPYLSDSPHHARSASVGEGSSIDTSRHSINSDSKVEMSNKSSPSRTIVVSKSAEKIAPNKASSNKTVAHNLMVQASKSHENYLECNEKLTFVEIDLDENMASSVDALHYEKSSSSLDSLGYVQFHEQSRSVEHSPDKRTVDKLPTKGKLMPTFISVEEPRSISKLKEGGKLRDLNRDDSSSSSQSSPSKSLKSEDRTRSPQSSPTHKPSAIPIRDSRGKPPRPPTRSTPTHSKPDTNTQSPPKPTGSRILVQDAPLDYTESALDASEPTSPVIESPLQTAHSHMVQTDLPTEEEEPIATSSAPPSPSPDTDPLADQLHHCPGGTDSNSSSPDAEQDPFNLDAFHQPLNEIDRPSAARLAKRLYQLDGFKKRDITRHLSKKNDFSFLVGEEYLKFFAFEKLTLDQALRTFLKNLTITGETQERERVLAHFSRRYLESNPDSYNSEDACHTLVCALMLLNTDLHGQNIGRKMAVNEFVDNLSDLNDGENFPKEVLKNLYHSIKDEPLECHFEDSDSDTASSQRGSHPQDNQRYLGHNPFLDIPDPSKATEYKKGYVMRKCCVDSDGRKTPMGKRGWKMFFATLRDMVLYLHKDDHAFKKNTMVASTTNAIRIHHSLAYRATDYKKKQHVIRLQTADWAQYLFQTSNSKECQEWIDTINFVAASLSAPPLPGGCGSQKKFQRPLLPASCTRLNMREQAQHHEQRLLQAEQDLHEHRKYPPEKSAKARILQDYMEKEVYLQFELRRFKVYSALLQMKLASFPEMEPSLVESAIGEVDEPSSHPSSPEQPRIIPLEADLPPGHVAPPPPSQQRASRPVQRSISDRPEDDRTVLSPSRLTSDPISPRNSYLASTHKTPPQNGRESVYRDSVHVEGIHGVPVFPISSGSQTPIFDLPRAPRETKSRVSPRPKPPVSPTTKSPISKMLYVPIQMPAPPSPTYETQV